MRFGGNRNKPCEEDGKLQVIGRPPALRFGLGGRKAPAAPLGDVIFEDCVR